MASPIRISRASTCHFDGELTVDRAPSARSHAIPASMNAIYAPPLTTAFTGAPRASDLLAQQLQNLNAASLKATGTRRSHSQDADANSSSPSYSRSRSRSRERDAHAALMRLKGLPSAAQTNLYTPLAKLWPGERDRSLSPVETTPSPVDSAGLSPTEITTPHSVLFRGSREGSVSGSITPGSSWSSCSKCSADSIDTTETVTTSLEALDETASDTKTVSISPDLHPSGAPLALGLDNSLEHDLESLPPVPQRPPSQRQRSLSDVMQRSECYATFLQDDAKTIGGQSESDSRTVSPSPSDSDADVPALGESVSLSLHNTENGVPDRSCKGPQDFSAYVSGIGEPIDPDTEFSSVAQLQTFRIHSRSRSVGPGDFREERLQNRRHGMASDTSATRSYTLSPQQRARILSPRPPLLNVRDTELIPSLSALGMAVCNPGYQLKPSRISPSNVKPVDEATPPASPRLTAHPQAPLMINGVLQLDAIPDASIDENGFKTVVSRHARRKLRRDTQRASRPPVADPEPISIDAIPETHDLAAEVEEPQEEDRRGRGRTRDRGRRSRPMQQHASEPLGAKVPFNCSGSVVAAPSSRHANGSRRSRRSRLAGMTYAAAATAGRSRDEKVDSISPDTRGRRGAVKIVNSSDDTTTVPVPASAPAVPCRTSGSPVPEPSEEEAVLPRPRLLSNGAHLLMLSLELAMIRNNKITCPLKARWGKRRDDDFRPIPNLQTRAKLALTRTSTPLSSPDQNVCTLVEEGGSSLKRRWSP